MESSSTRSRKTSTACSVTLTVPAVLPREIAERLEKGELHPSALFTVTLTDEAMQEHGLDEFGRVRDRLPRGMARQLRRAGRARA
jgi:hypothetical protein